MKPPGKTRKYNHTRIEVGQRYGMWTVLELPKAATKNTSIFVKCRCDCGTERMVKKWGLVNEKYKSCGCVRVEILRSHGKCFSREYSSWAAMKSRCSNPNDIRYSDYGGRGISVCAGWEKFEGFYADMGDRPIGTSLGRIDNSLGYSKANCRWETSKEQALNRRSNHLITAYSQTMTVTEWERVYGINRHAIGNRILSGWPPELAVKQPINKRQRLRRLLNESG